ncbi:MAG TPA: serine hydrolase [Chitinophagaceae bacterium]|nr:serine hydrolase [Chitinophagaceae bacterium]
MFGKINVTLLFAAFAASLIQASGQPKIQEIDQLIQKYADHGYFNGTILVAENDKIIYQKAFGYSNFEWKIRNTIESAFRIGSLTKPITASLVLKLVQEGKIRLQNTINDYLPYYPAHGRNISLHQLLNHTSGIPSFTNRPDLERINKNYIPVDSFVLRYCSGAPEFPPGSNFRYNNSGYYILGAIIEKVTGSTYAEALQRYLFHHLKMEHAGFFNNDQLIPNRAYGYVRSLTGLIPAGYYDMTIPFSTGGVTSTVPDLLKWVRLFQDNSVLHDSLIKKTNEASSEVRSGQGYSYGWFIEKKKMKAKEITIVSHGGEVDGFNSLVIRIPEDDKVIIFVNNTGVTKIREIGFTILNLLYDEPTQLPKKNMNAWIGQSLKNNGADKTLQLYNALDKTEYSNLVPEELGTWSRYLLRINRTDEALLLMQFVTQINPQSFLAQNLLGDIYRRMGNKELARKAYEESLRLNPGNFIAEEGLRALR